MFIPLRGKELTCWGTRVEGSLLTTYPLNSLNLEHENALSMQKIETKNLKSDCPQMGPVLFLMFGLISWGLQS